MYRNPLIVTAAAIILPWSLIRFVLPKLIYDVVPFVPSAVFFVWMFTRSPLDARAQSASVAVPMAATILTASSCGGDARRPYAAPSCVHRASLAACASTS